MIRWFRGRKHKRKCYDSSDDSPSEYGFKDSKSRDSSPYGFTKQVEELTNQVQVDEDRVQYADVVPHVDQSGRIVIDCKNSSTSVYGTTTAHAVGTRGSASPHIYDEIKDLPDTIIASQFRILTGLKFSSSHSDEEGPYMVVPVLPARRIPAKSSAVKSAQNQSSFSKCSSKEVTNQRESLCDSTKPTNTPDTVSKSPTYESVDLLNCSKSDTDSIVLPIRAQNVKDAESDSECDLNTTGSEGEYPVFLDKIEQNLFLKQQVREIIQSLSGADSSQTRCSRNDSFSTVSTETSAVSPVPASTSSEVSDPEVFADQSESEDEKVDHACQTESMETQTVCDASTAVDETSSASTDLRKSVQKQRKRTSKSRKPKLKTYCVKDKEHETKLQSVIQEDTEMYLLPSCKDETDYYNYKTYRKPVLIPTLPTKIYQDPDRLKNNKNNKLLGDLIRMNYDKQHLIQV